MWGFILFWLFPEFYLFCETWMLRALRKFHIIGGEGDGPICFNHKVTFSFYVWTVKIIHISKFHNHDSKDIFIEHFFWCDEFWPTTKKFSFYTFFIDDIFPESGIKSYRVNYGFDKISILFKCNCSFLFSNHFTRYLSCNRIYISLTLECITQE